MVNDSSSNKSRANLAVTTRIAEARGNFKQLSRLWKHTTMPLQRKLVIYRACVVQKLTYALYTHVIAEADMNRIESFHAQCLRQILGIKSTHATKNILFTETISNQEVLKRAEETYLRTDIENLRIKYFAHIYRRPNTAPERITLLKHNSIEAAPWRGKRPHKRPPPIPL